MTEVQDAEQLVDELAEDFAHRWRAGERPSIEEYVLRCPQYADEIRSVLPAVVMMERLKPNRDDTELPSQSPPTPTPPPARIGDYRIIREIARGGMGVVYEADQEKLGRHVAIKVLPGPLLANERMRQRFLQEAQAAARLHHTNIVPVFGIGEQEGLCYYVMQLIDGRGLDRIISETASARRSTQQGSATVDLPSDRPAPSSMNSRNSDQTLPAGLPVANPPLLPPLLAPLAPADYCRMIARIGIQVGDALEYAHAEGILHRDIKPANLLLNDRGFVWITDFGVAKIVEGANLTQSGDLIGTLKYMPPERFSGQSDARGDVYSLGVTLYELLTLQSAFPDTTPHHLIHLITHEAPNSLRKVNREIPKDLETIVLKSIARDPDRRYQTPGQLADDLRRFIDDRPILARRVGPAEQALRWSRRNPQLASAVAAVFVLMVAVTVVSVAANARTSAAHHETERANREMEQTNREMEQANREMEQANRDLQVAKGDVEKALAAEKTQLDHAERTATLSLEALNRTFDRFAPTRLVVAPSAETDDGIELPLPTLPPEAIPLLEDLLRTYERIAQDAGKFPRLHAQAAEANHRIGDIHRRLGRFEKAAVAYQAAIELYVGLTARSSPDENRIKLARAYNELGRTFRSLQKREESVRMHELAIQTLVDAPQAFATRPECRYEMACSYYALGQRDMFVTPNGIGFVPIGGMPHHGMEFKGAPFSKRPPNVGPGDPKGPKGGPGDSKEPKDGKGPKDSPGDSKELMGDQNLRKAVELLERLLSEYGTVPEYKHLLACSYRDMEPSGRQRGPQMTERYSDKAIALLRQLVADYSKVPDYRFDLSETLGRSATRDPSGDARLEEAIAQSTELIANYPNVPEYTAAHARQLDHRGVRFFELKNFDESERFLRRAIGHQTKLVEQHPDAVAYHLWLSLMERSLGRTQGWRGKVKEARELLERSVNRAEAILKKDSRVPGVRTFLAKTYGDLGLVLTRMGQIKPALTAFRKAEQYSRERSPAPRDGGTRK